MQRDYRRGLVWWKGPRVAEWDGSKGELRFLGEGEKMKEAHAKLMQSE